jgi:hypothetical protein
MKEYKPDLTPKEQERLKLSNLWQRDRNDWVNQETGERRMWHPLAVEIGEHCYKSARKLNNGKKLRR